MTSKILRFHRSERLLHWAIAEPFLVCYTTAIVLVVYYNPDPHRPYHMLFAWAHRI
jgi:cytochrome b subunit of formate dehydrogenase